MEDILISVMLMDQLLFYRKEEWLKVVIHECFHSFGLEFSNLDLKDFNKNLKKIIPINSNFNIFESYSEVLGRNNKYIFNFIFI